jgi:hypothetical protein
MHGGTAARPNKPTNPATPSRSRVVAIVAADLIVPPVCIIPLLARDWLRDEIKTSQPRPD